jgi:hypothetical protein
MERALDRRQMTEVTEVKLTPAICAVRLAIAVCFQGAMVTVDDSAQEEDKTNMAMEEITTEYMQ